jgi:exodeoxyribonuclease VII large subunit
MTLMFDSNKTVDKSEKLKKIKKHNSRLDSWDNLGNISNNSKQPALSQLSETQKKVESDINDPGSESSPSELTHIGGAKIFSISEITKMIKGYLENNPDFNNIWLRGEISNLTQHRSGHMYFDLKDKDTVVSCVMFRSANQHLKFKPEHGLKVLGFGSINLYPPHGKYQFIMTTLMPDGIGALHLAFTQLKDKLSKEGLFAYEHKKPIPKLPKLIGVITSSTGAAIRDIIHVSTRRFPGVNILLVPSKVQGNAAVGELIKGIELLHSMDGVDLIIIGRGGGSLEDLWAFNEEPLARAIYDARIPIISAVGHETDFTISDFVADVRAPTPSAAAELAVPDKDELIRTIGINLKQIYNIIRTKNQNFRFHLDRLLESPAFRRPLDRTNQLRQNLDNVYTSLITNVSNYLGLKRTNLDLNLGKLTALNPSAILGRGYCMTIKLPDQKLVSSVKDISIPDSVKVVFKDGAVRCIVEEKLEDIQNNDDAE